MKKESQVIIAFLSVVVLAAGYFVLKNVILKDDEITQDTAVINKNVEDLDSVTISVWGEKEFTIEASGQTPNRVFQIADYTPGFKFRQLAMNTVFSKVSKIEPQKKVDENPQDLSVYGLRDPKSVVKTRYKDGTSDEIRIGNETPLRDGYYATVNGDTVYTVDMYLGNTLTKNQYFFRDPDLIPAWDSPSDQINYVSLKQNGFDEIEVKRLTQDEKNRIDASESKFYMTKPTDSPVDEEYLSVNLLYPISRLYSDANVFEDSPKNPELYGITKDSAQLTIMSENGEYKILIGNRTPNYSGYFVMREGTSSISEVTADIIDTIVSVDPKKLAAS